jgi:hypothetical protein
MSVRSKITVLTSFLLLCLLGAVITAWFQNRAEEDVKPADLYAVVERQLGEFRGGDFSHAYEYASRAVQERYSVLQFTEMVENDYPGMTHVTRAEYGLVRAKEGHATLQAYLVGEDGAITPCLYIMVREGDGWRIDGAKVMPMLPPDVRVEGTML